MCLLTLLQVTNHAGHTARLASKWRPHTLAPPRLFAHGTAISAKELLRADLARTRARVREAAPVAARPASSCFETTKDKMTTLLIADRKHSDRRQGTL